MPACATGLAAPTAAFTGFGTDWFDYDNDGWLDLFVANGAVNVIEAQRGQPRPFRMRNQLFHNTGQGRFEDDSVGGGPAFARAEIGRGAAFGDIDNDGDIDIVVTNNGGPVRLLLNQRRVDESLAVSCSCPRAQGTASRSAQWSASSARDGQRCGGAFGPTAAICRRATRASISASARRRPWTRSSSAGRTVRSSDGRASRRIGS